MALLLLDIGKDAPPPHSRVITVLALIGVLQLIALVYFDEFINNQNRNHVNDETLQFHFNVHSN
jgi:hypothetical protein